MGSVVEFTRLFSVSWQVLCRRCPCWVARCCKSRAIRLPGPAPPRWLQRCRPMRKREKIQGRFKSARQTQRFLAVHDEIANLFRPCRHKMTPSTYRQKRANAFRQWNACADELLLEIPPIYASSAEENNLTMAVGYLPSLAIREIWGIPRLGEPCNETGGRYCDPNSRVKRC